MRGRLRTRLGLLLTCFYALLSVVPSNLVLCTEPDGRTDAELALYSDHCSCACLADKELGASLLNARILIEQHEPATISATCTDVHLSAVTDRQQLQLNLRPPAPQSTLAIRSGQSLALQTQSCWLGNRATPGGTGPPHRSTQTILRI
jgi:hypothetical protein